MTATFNLNFRLILLNWKKQVLNSFFTVTCNRQQAIGSGYVLGIGVPYNPFLVLTYYYLNSIFKFKYF